MAKMGDWRADKDMEIELDGIGGVNILVKADVHRSGTLQTVDPDCFPCHLLISLQQASISHAMPLKIKLKPRASRRWPKELATRSMACLTMSFGISIQRKSLAISKVGLHGHDLSAQNATPGAR
jgi:Anp1